MVKKQLTMKQSLARSKKAKRKPVNKGNLKKRNLQPYVETKAIETTAASLFMDTTSAVPDTKPQATTVIVPDAWAVGLHRGLNPDQVIGQDVFDRYLNMKMLISFNTLLPATQPPSAIANIRYVQGWVKRQQSSSVLSAHYAATDYHTIVLKTFVDNDFGSNFLSYSSKWKDLKIIKSGYLRPKNTNKNFNPESVAASDTIGPHQEPIRMKFNWRIQRKNRLTPADAGEVHFRADSWIPFVAFYSSSLHNQTPNQVPSISHVSKLWFTDS